MRFRNLDQDWAISPSRTDTEGTIVALAGRRIDAEPADEPRFPFANVKTVRDAISVELRFRQAKVLVCSAACGADLLALDAARELGLRTRVILPFSAGQFRSTSVVDRPNPDFWGPLFDNAIEKARSQGDLIELNGTAGDDVAYSAASRTIVEETKLLAQSSIPQSEPIAIVVWNKVPRGSSDVTQEFADLSKESGFEVIELETLGTH